MTNPTQKRFWETSEFWKDAMERIVMSFINGTLAVLTVDMLTGPRQDLVGYAILGGGVGAVLSTLKALIGSQRSDSTTPVSIT
jgi:hypothetical protein